LKSWQVLAEHPSLFPVALTVSEFYRRSRAGFNTLKL